METLKRKYLRLLKLTSTKHIRGIYHRISWETRLVGIKGARGVGKTTLLLQRIKLSSPSSSSASYTEEKEQKIPSKQA